MEYGPALLSILSILAVSLVSLVGILALALNQRLLNSLIPILVGLAAGALLGDAFVHLIPEALEEIGDEQLFAIAIVTGLAFFFILEKWLRWHHAHHGPEEEHEGHEKFEMGAHPNPHLAPLVIIADGLHNLVDGALIAASFLVSPALGIATTIAVFLHEIPQEIADFALLIHAGLSRAKALLFNFASALTAFLGALLVFIAAESIESFAPLAVAFTAGGFIYIAAADLVPELQRNTRVRESVVQILAFAIGLVIMFFLLGLE
jgi:zinc and cadmium transporter